MSCSSNNNNNVLDVCRLCLNNDEDLIPVISEFDSDLNLRDKINLCVSIQVDINVNDVLSHHLCCPSSWRNLCQFQISTDDKISQKICESCLIKVDSFCAFRNVTSESQKVLENRLRANEEAVNQLNLMSQKVISFSRYICI